MGRRWTEEEEEYLSSFWGIRSLESISKYLNRTQCSVKNKLLKMGIGSSKLNSDFIPVYDIMFSLYGYKNSISLERFLAKGLKCRNIYHRNKKVKAVKIENFWEWAEKNQDKLNFRKFEEFSLGEEPSWVNEKRKMDKFKFRQNNANKRWSREEDNHIIYLLKLGKKYDEISLELNRTYNAVAHRALLLKKYNRKEMTE